MTIKHDGDSFRHVGRVWDVSTWLEKHASLRSSETLKQHLTSPKFKVPSQSSFCEHSCPCLSNPTSHSCVNIIKSKSRHCMKAIATESRLNTQLRHATQTRTCPLHAKQKSEQWTTQLTNSIEKFMRFTCCSREPHPTLKSSEHAPSFMKPSCADGTCPSCGPSSLHLNSCPMFNEETSLIDTNE